MRKSRQAILFQVVALVAAALLYAGCNGGGSGGGGGDGDGGGSSGTTTGGTPVLENDVLYPNRIVLDRDVPNTLKGMMVAVDDAAGVAYVTGIMTTTVAVVDLSTGQLLRAFSVSSSRLYATRMAFDPVQRRLWLVSGQGVFLKIVDPDTETVLVDADISGDLAANPPPYPIKDIALDYTRQRCYVARADGGTRVSVYGSSGTLLGDILEFQSVVELEWDAAADELVALTAPQGAQGDILYLPQGDEQLMTSISAPYISGQQPPNMLALDGNGDVYVAGPSIWKIGRSSGQTLWTTSVLLTISRLEVSGSEVGALHRNDPDGSATEYQASLSTFNTADGQFITNRDAGYESSRMAPIAAGGFLVGYAGDAKVGIFPVGSGAPTEVQVGTAVSDFHYTNDGRLLILNRLGGSQLIEYTFATGQSRVLDETVVGAWPMRMVIRETDDKIFIVSHYETKLSVLRLSDLTKLGEIDLVSAVQVSDTISDMAADPNGDLMACLLCELGLVVMVDGATGSILATISLGGVREGAGPGRMNACVDPVGRSVYVFMDDNNTLYRLDESNGFQADPQASAVIFPDQNARYDYALMGMYYSQMNDRVFLWNQVVNPGTLQVEQTLTDAQRLITEHGGYLYAESHETTGETTLLVLDPSNYSTVASLQGAEFYDMSGYFDFDFANGRCAHGVSAESEVHFFDLPVVP